MSKSRSGARKKAGKEKVHEETVEVRWMDGEEISRKVKKVKMEKQDKNMKKEDEKENG